MSKNAFIIHGLEGYPEENWFPWLKKQLEMVGYHTIVPQFPTPQNQSLDNWKAVFENYKQLLNEDTIFIGHSLGPSFILSILEDINLNIKGSFLVAPFVRKLGIKEIDNINDTFINKDFDWTKIKKHCNKFFIYSSNNDPYVPIEESKYISNNVNGTFILVENAGHFNERAGYLKFEQLLEDIKNL